MRRRNPRQKAAIVLAVFVLTALGLAVKSVSPADATSPGRPEQSQADEHVAVCGAVPAGYARCHALREVKQNRRPTTTTTTAPPTSSTTTTSTTTTVPPTTLPSTTVPAAGCSTAHSGLTPCDLQSAYALDTTKGSGLTVAIVDAFDNPNAEADLATYRSTYNLPPCTTANGCFRKVDQNGGTAYPGGNTGWGQEIALDLDMVSSVCPGCHILLVEATTNSYVNLFTAVDTAAALGANAISNSYGGSEFSSETLSESHFNHPGIAITVSSGDSGYGVEYPAASRYVTAVGGTTLTRNGSARGWGEVAWKGAGSGCSKFIAKPAWQTDAGCAKRTVADVSAIANPSTGVAVYDTYGSAGWLVFGGTSVASPIIASVYALAGNTGSINDASYAYGHTSSLNDVTSGSNGNCGSYLCTAGLGYDGPTGLGTPNGSGGF